MATQKETVNYIMEKLDNDAIFSVRPMFGEYSLYVDGKVVALIADDTLYVKMLPVSEQLESICEKGPPYPGAKLCYIVTEDQLVSITDLPAILIAIAQSLPAKKIKSK